MNSQTRIARGLILFAVCALNVLHANAETLFSVRRAGPSGLSASTIYIPGTPLSGPIPVSGAEALGLDPALDSLNGFSANKKITSDFLLCFSVDKKTKGAAEPFPFSTASGPISFNVKNQATNKQQAGDAFISTEAFARGGFLPGRGLGIRNNILVINQSPTYVSNFNLKPRLSPSFTSLDDDIDDVNGGESLPLDSMGMPMLEPFYFTLDPESPSLDILSGLETPSPANIFFDSTVELVDGPSADASLFATASDLGLAFEDIITSLTVFDDNDDGIYNGTDQILFSLDESSPTLASLDISSGDILTVTAGLSPSLFAEADALGLDPDTDHVNMLVPVPMSSFSAGQVIQAKLIPEPRSSLLLLWIGAGLGLTQRRRPSA